MKQFRTDKPFVVTQGNTNRRKGAFDQLQDAMDCGNALTANTRRKYFEVWTKGEHGYTCKFYEHNARVV